MINVQSTLQHMNISHTSVSRGLQDLRGRLSRASSMAVGASKFIHELLDHDIKFRDDNSARITAFAVLEGVIKRKCVYDDASELVKEATSRADQLMKDPVNMWMFAEAESSVTSPTEKVAVVDGLDAKVEVKADGSIKKGGKQVLAMELYRKHVIENAAPISQSDFVKILMSDLGMTKAGANTYAYNAKKAHEAEMKKA